MQEFDPQKLILFSKNDVIAILRNLIKEVSKLKSSYSDEHAVSRMGVVSLIEDIIEEIVK